MRCPTGSISQGQALAWNTSSLLIFIFIFFISPFPSLSFPLSQGAEFVWYAPWKPSSVPFIPGRERQESCSYSGTLIGYISCKDRQLESYRQNGWGHSVLTFISFPSFLSWRAGNYKDSLPLYLFSCFFVFSFSVSSLWAAGECRFMFEYPVYSSKQSKPFLKLTRTTNKEQQN